MKQGDNYNIRFQLTMNNGQPYDLTNGRIYFQQKKSFTSTEYVIVPKLPSFVDNHSGLVIFTITSDISKKLIGEYLCEIIYENSLTGEKFDVSNFTLYVKKQIIDTQVYNDTSINNALRMQFDLIRS